MDVKAKNKAKPFFKWAGGKGQLLDIFEGFYPKDLKERKIDNYYEPFVGGGAVFFDVAQKYDIRSAKLFDVNEELILTYRVIQKDVEKLIDFLERYGKRYLALNQKNRKEYYYEMRQNYNLQRFNLDYLNYSEMWIPRAAQSIFLNRTCFNGLFRFNSKGEFNTPVGDYKNPKICDSINLMNASKVLDIAEIRMASFQEIVAATEGNNGFVYFDPPYRPLSKSASFISYSKYGFGDEEQKMLANVFNKLHQKGMKVMLSNSDPKNVDPADNFFDELYSNYHIYRVPANRMINADAKRRGKIHEIVVTNY